MVNLHYPCQPNAEASIILLMLGSTRLCSDPFPTGNAAAMQPVQIPLLDTDEFSSESGSGEHPVTHHHVDGDIHISYGSSFMDAMSDETWSPLRSPGNKPYWFSKTRAKKYNNHLCLSSVNGKPREEYMALPLKSYGWHTCWEGDISPSSVEVTMRDGLWADNTTYYNGYIVQWSLSSVAHTPNSITYEGVQRSGRIPVGTTPKTFPTVLPQEWSSKEVTISASVYQIGALDNDLSYAMATLAAEGLENAIKSKYLEGLALLGQLSCTSDAMDAVSGVRALDSNNIENAVQSTDMVGMIPPLAPVFKLAANPTDPVQYARVASDLYLWYKYVAKPTVSDIKGMLEAARGRATDTLTQLKGGVYRSSSTEVKDEWTCTTSARVALHPYAATATEKVVNVLDNIGLSPSLARAWDLVPFSFVVDWFTNASSCLAAIDTNLFTSRYDVETVTTGRKVLANDLFHSTWEFGSLRVQCNGIDFSFYEREVKPYFPVDPHLNLRGLTTTGHILAGAALLVGVA